MTKRVSKRRGGGIYIHHGDAKQGYSKADAWDLIFELQKELSEQGFPSDTLGAYWGYDEDWSGYDLMFHYPLARSNADGSMLHSHLCHRYYLTNYRSRDGYSEEKSLKEELVDRGYDLSTLFMSIKRLPKKED